MQRVTSSPAAHLGVFGRDAHLLLWLGRFRTSFRWLGPVARLVKEKWRVPGPRRRTCVWPV